MDTAELVWIWGTGRTGALAAGSCWGGLDSGGGLCEVDDAARASAAFPAAAVETFIPRAASCHNTQTPGLDPSVIGNANIRISYTKEHTWSSQAFFSFSWASLLFFSNCSLRTAARAFAWACQGKNKVQEPHLNNSVMTVVIIDDILQTVTRQSLFAKLTFKASIFFLRSAASSVDSWLSEPSLSYWNTQRERVRGLK